MISNFLVFVCNTLTLLCKYVWLVSHEVDGEPSYLDNEDDKSLDEVSVEHVTTSDVSALESVCEEIGFVMCANQSSRLVILLFIN